MSNIDLQQKLFQHIKSRMAAEASVADEIAGLLGISADSAYRRIRGEKQVTFEELVTLCTHYKVSLDQLLQIETGAFIFQGSLLNDKIFRYDAYLTSMKHSMAYFASFKEKEYYYLCKDVPIFHHWHCREYAVFKYFFQMSILIYFPEFRNKKVTMEEYPDELLKSGQEILGYYNQLDSYEVWNLGSLNSLLQQVEYYREAQMFHSDQDALKVYEAVDRTLEHIEEQAALGYKFDINDPQKKRMGKFMLYTNEIIVLDNSMLAVLDNTKIAVVPHSVINYMLTRDLAFCENLSQYMQNILRRSTLLSETSEKERGRFFRILRERIERRKEKLNV